jgi:hypothetical protein
MRKKQKKKKEEKVGEIGNYAGLRGEVKWQVVGKK